MHTHRKTPLQIEVTEAHMCSVDVRLQILGRVPFFNGPQHAELEQINRLFHEHGYKPDDTICFAGDLPGVCLWWLTCQTDAPLAIW